MKKLFNGFKLSNFISALIIGLAYPIIKTIISENKMLVFSDTTCIISMFFLLFGIFNNLFLKGDFDVTSYITTQLFTKDKKQPYKQYKESLNEKREGSFNYPLFVGLILLIISLITAKLV